MSVHYLIFVLKSQRKLKGKRDDGTARNFYSQAILCVMARSEAYGNQQRPYEQGDIDYVEKELPGRQKVK